MNRFWPFLLLCALFSACGIGIQQSIGVYATDRSLTGDEASHFVNSTLILDYFREYLFKNPLKYAALYYSHLPRVSIGHWPPGFYILQAAAFALTGRSSAVAIALQALIGGVACGGVAEIVRRRIGWAAGLATGLVVLASPTLMFLLGAVMLDTALGVWFIGAALCWAEFTRSPRLRWAALFVVCAIGTITTKGNGLALAFVPIFHAILTRNLRPLLDWRALLTAAIIGIVGSPWYLFTFKMVSEGFAYKWGWDYTSQALPGYAVGILNNIGVICIIGFFIGVARIFPRNVTAIVDHKIAAMASVTFSIIMFQLIVPSEITPRYLVPLVPCTAIVSAVGIESFLRLIATRWQIRHGSWISGTVMGILLLNAALIARLPHSSQMHMINISKQLLQCDGDNKLVMVGGALRAQGALISAFAELDLAHRYYILRADQILATSNMMGTQYHTRFADVTDVKNWLADSGIGWLVLDTSKEGAAMAHNLQLLALADALPNEALVARYPNEIGEIRIYRLTDRQPTPAQMSDLLTRILPKWLPPLSSDTTQ